MSTRTSNPHALAPEAHAVQFDPNAYYTEYAQSNSSHPRYARTISKLPLMTKALPTDLTTMLDLGAGPTVHLLIAMRHHVRKMYTSDYAEECRTTLADWAMNKQRLDVDYVCKLLAETERRNESPGEMQSLTRGKLQAVLSVDVTNQDVVRGIHWKRDEQAEVPKQFQVVSCGFLLEAASSTKEDYCRVFGNACSLVERGGYLIVVERMGIKSYAVGEKSFETHSVQLEDMLHGLEKHGLSTDLNDGLGILAGDGVCLLTSRKL